MPHLVKTWLAAAMALLVLLPPAFPLPLRAQEGVPPHLARFAAQIVKANRTRLKNPGAGANPQKAAVIARGYRALKRSSMHLWSARAAPANGVLRALASALGVKPGNAKSSATIARFLGRWKKERDPAAVKELLKELGRDPLPDEALEKLRKTLSAIKRKHFGGLRKRYTIKADDNIDIDLEWPGPGHEMTLSVLGKNAPGSEPFEITMKGRVEFSPGEDGRSLAMRAEPDAKAPLEALGAKALAERRKSLLGVWYDQKGREWRIEGAERTDGPLTLSYLDGPGRRVVYRNARLRGRSITATRLYASVEELKSGLPVQIKTQLVNNPAAFEQLELTFHPAAKGKEGRIAGRTINLHVTYDPDSYEISKIGNPYSRPLMLMREKRKKTYRIGKLKADTLPLRVRIQDLVLRMERIEQEIAFLKQVTANNRKDDERAKSNLARLDAEQRRIEAAMARTERAITQLLTPPQMKDTERQALEQLRGRIAEAELRQEAGVLTASEAVVLRQDRRLLADLERRIASRRPAAYRTPEALGKKVHELRAGITRGRNEMLALKLERVRARFDLAYARERAKSAMNERGALEKTLAHYRRLHAQLKKRLAGGGGKSRPVEWITVRTAKGKSIYSAVAQPVPFEDMLRAFDREIADAREKVARARRLRDRASNLFVSETRRSIALGEELAETIMESARGKRNAAIAKLAAGVIKDFVKGGPVAAAGGAAYKLLVETPALNLASGRGAYARKQVSSFDESALRQQFENAFRGSLRESLSARDLAGEAAGMIGKRAKKAALSTALKDRTKSLVLRNGFGRWAQRMAAKGRVEDLSAFLKSNARNAWLKRRMAQRRADFLAKMFKDLKKLKAPNPASGLRGKLDRLLNTGNLKRMARDFDFKKAARKVLRNSPEVIKKFGQSVAEGMVMDFAEAMLKKHFETAEKRAWIAYLNQEMIARTFFAGWREAQRHYFETVDMLEALLQARNRFLAEVDRNSNFRIEQSDPFDADARLMVRLYSGNVKTKLTPLSGQEASVTLDGLQATPKPAPLSEGARFVIDATRIKRENGARLPLSVSLK